MDPDFDFSDLNTEFPGLNDTVPDLVGLDTTDSLLASMTGPKLEVSQVEADLTARVLAKLIDVGLAFAISWIVSLPFYGWFMGLLIGGIAGSAYLLLSDSMNGPRRRSFGKKWINLRIEQCDGTPVDTLSSIRRNWMFTGLFVAQAFAIVAPTLGALLLAATLGGLAFEFMTLYYDYEGQRWGDRLAQTAVLQSATAAARR